MAISCALHVAAALAPYLIFFRIPEAAALPVVFLIRVVVPVILGSITVAVISLLFLRRQAQPSASIGEAIALTRTGGTDVLAMSLVATMIAILAVLFLGAYGFIVLHLFYGPPVAMQVLASERLPLRDSLSTARSYLHGNWRLLAYLFAVALLVGLVTFVILGAAFAGLRNAPEPTRTMVMVVSQGLITGALAAFVAAAQVALYLQLRSLWPGPSQEPAS